MNVYAIHRENVWTTDYNVAIYSSKKMAEKQIHQANLEYARWHQAMEQFHSYGADHMDFIYNNPQPARYRIEQLKVVKRWTSK